MEYLRLVWPALSRVQVTEEEVSRILKEVRPHILPTSGSDAVKVLAGGSVANTIRGLAGGLKIPCSIVGARGDDELGQMFVSNLKQSGVNLTHLRATSGNTGQVNPSFIGLRLSNLLAPQILWPL